MRILLEATDVGISMGLGQGLDFLRVLWHLMIMITNPIMNRFIKQNHAGLTSFFLPIERFIINVEHQGVRV